MPYIPEDRRAVFNSLLEQLSGLVESQGELNYCIYKLSTLLLDRMGTSYDTLSLCSSAMEHAKLEWYRKKMAPYEDKKIARNGDI